MKLSFQNRTQKSQLNVEAGPIGNVLRYFYGKLQLHLAGFVGKIVAEGLRASGIVKGDVTEIIGIERANSSPFSYSTYNVS